MGQKTLFSLKPLYTVLLFIIYYLKLYSHLSIQVWEIAVVSSTWGLYCKSLQILWCLCNAPLWCFHGPHSYSMDLFKSVTHTKYALDVRGLFPWGRRKARKSSTCEKNIEKVMQTARLLFPWSLHTECTFFCSTSQPHSLLLVINKVVVQFLKASSNAY